MSMAAYGNDHGSYMLSKAAADRSANGTVAPTHMLTMHQATPPQALPATKLAPAIVNTLAAAPAVHRAYSSPSICGGDSPTYMNGMRGMQSAQQHDFIPPRCNTAMSLNVPLREPDPPPRPSEQVVNNSLTALREDAPASTSWSVAQQPAEIEEDVNNDGEIDIQIRNVVCTYSLPLHIDLHRVALNSGNVTFDRGRGVLLKQKRNPMCYVKVYSSGKIYIVGCRSETECKQAARGVARMVQKCMGRTWDTVRMRNYRICNVLATCKMPFGIKIEEVLLCDFVNGAEPAFLVGVDIIIFDIGLFHSLWGIDNCVAEHLDGGYGRCLWCLSHIVAFLVCLPFAFVSRPKPYSLWPLLIQQSAYGVGLLILSLAALPRVLPTFTGNKNSASMFSVLVYAAGASLNFLLLYIYWHWYWHVESMWSSARKMYGDHVTVNPNLRSKRTLMRQCSPIPGLRVDSLDGIITMDDSLELGDSKVNWRDETPLISKSFAMESMAAAERELDSAMDILKENGGLVSKPSENPAMQNAGEIETTSALGELSELGELHEPSEPCPDSDSGPTKELRPSSVVDRGGSDLKNLKSGPPTSRSGRGSKPVSGLNPNTELRLDSADQSRAPRCSPGLGRSFIPRGLPASPRRSSTTAYSELYCMPDVSQPLYESVYEPHYMNVTNALNGNEYTRVQSSVHANHNHNNNNSSHSNGNGNSNNNSTNNKANSSKSIAIQCCERGSSVDMGKGHEARRARQGNSTISAHRRRLPSCHRQPVANSSMYEYEYEKYALRAPPSPPRTNNQEALSGKRTRAMNRIHRMDSFDMDLDCMQPLPLKPMTMTMMHYSPVRHFRL